MLAAHLKPAEEPRTCVARPLVWSRLHRQDAGLGGPEVGLAQQLLGRVVARVLAKKSARLEVESARVPPVHYLGCQMRNPGSGVVRSTALATNFGDPHFSQMKRKN